MYIALLGGQAVTGKIVKQKKKCARVHYLSLTIHDPPAEVQSFFPTLPLFRSTVIKYLDLNYL